jgi:23S rRNA (cytosine1962-C5)-methyltransferase
LTGARNEHFPQDSTIFAETFLALAQMVKKEMHPSYRLLDAGLEEKLERFGEVVTVRPAPAATGERKAAGLWTAVQARFDAGKGWQLLAPLPEPWRLVANGIVHELELGAAGQVGYFPEQEELRRWIAKRIARARREEKSDPVRVLNLFASTGGSTLAAAHAGARVTHVDSQRAAVRAARRNAALNETPNDSIRWIEEDARRWVDREIRRGSRYEAVILDPPSFGRGPSGRTWKIERDLAALLEGCAAIMGESAQFVLCTAHSEGMDQRDLRRELDRAFASRGGKTDLGELVLAAESGARLGAGFFALRDFQPGS